MRRKWGHVHEEITLVLLLVALIPLFYPGGNDMLWIAIAAQAAMIVVICSHPLATSLLVRRQAKNVVQSLRRCCSWRDDPLTIRLMIVGVMALVVPVTGHVYTQAVTGLGQWHRSMGQMSIYAFARPTLLEQTVELIEEQAHRYTDLAVLIPSTNTDFWETGTRRNARSMHVPALTGIPMLMGLLPEGDASCHFDCSIAGYGNEFYGADATVRNPSSAEICAHARARHVGHVFVLRDARLHPERNETLDCRPTT